ncbi:MAG: LPS-assembly protein LptD [Alphaproteobacteria bacterium]|nr:LPS-assembly protein LptD [Alphaproteobacteria bacterium]PHX99556.1 MAG: organic solvent tolerance protein [Rhodospirillaceae bacterium]
MSPVDIFSRLVAGLALCSGFSAAAQTSPEATATKNSTELQADEMNYEEATDTLKAIGRVEVTRDGRVLLADTVTYNQGTDIAVATGNVSMLDKNGTVMFFDRLEMKGDLKEGFAKEVRVLLADKSRLTSREFRRTEGRYNEMSQATYSACDIVCEDLAPIWQIKASRVQYDEEAEMVYYRNARVELLGIPMFYTPYLAHPDPTSGRKSGLLLPIISGGRNLGLSYAQPYYINISPDKDATLSPLITTSAGKGMTGEYRQRFGSGEFQLFGSVVGDDADSSKDARGHLRGRARWDMDDKWRSGADVHLASDRTYLRRYNFEAPTWLTTNAYAERFSSHSYFSANTYHFQRQRRTVAVGTTPIIAPLLQYNYVGDQTGRSGYFSADANALVLLREEGSDSNRLSAKVGWTLPYTSPLGDIYMLRTTLRTDGYYVRDVARLSRNDTFTGTAGRVLPEASLEWRFPLVRNDGNAHQLLEPIVMGVVSPTEQNPEKIPNEDSRDLEFDDTNLFDTQRVSGLDRVEGGARVNYGLRWSAYGARGGSVASFIGQSYRFNRDNTFTPISGLSEKLSDIVGRIDAAPNPYVNLLYRFRLNKDSLGSRRNEFGATLGPEISRLGVSYIFLKQDPTNRALGEREELFTSFSTRLTKYWSLNASHRQDLSPNGGRIRTAFGFTYEDECSIFGLDIADDNTQDRDFKRGLTVLLRFNLKTIGDIKFNTGVGAQK